MSLQEKIYGHHKHSSTLLKKMGSYNGAPLRRMGHYNSSPKKMGSYNGVGAHKTNLTMEAYPRY